MFKRQRPNDGSESKTTRLMLSILRREAELEKMEKTPVSIFIAGPNPSKDRLKQKQTQKELLLNSSKKTTPPVKSRKPRRC